MGGHPGAVVAGMGRELLGEHPCPDPLLPRLLWLLPRVDPYGSVGSTSGTAGSLRGPVVVSQGAWQVGRAWPRGRGLR